MSLPEFLTFRSRYARNLPLWKLFHADCGKILKQASVQYSFSELNSEIPLTVSPRFAYCEIFNDAKAFSDAPIPAESFVVRTYPVRGALGHMRHRLIRLSWY
jgi:hypothetical protein